MNAPSHALAWLDAYEGIDPLRPGAGEYERVERPVRLATSDKTTAWVYLYRKDVAGLDRVGDGRWVAQPR